MYESECWWQGKVSFYVGKTLHVFKGSLRIKIEGNVIYFQASRDGCTHHKTFDLTKIYGHKSELGYFKGSNYTQSNIIEPYELVLFQNRCTGSVELNRYFTFSIWMGTPFNFKEFLC